MVNEKKKPTFGGNLMNSLNPLQQRSFLKALGRSQKFTSSRLANSKAAQFDFQKKPKRQRRRSNIQNYLGMKRPTTAVHSGNSYKNSMLQNTSKHSNVVLRDYMNSNFLRSIKRKKRLFQTEEVKSTFLHPKQFMKMTKKGPVRFRRIFSARKNIL